ncbi:hypothetical protein [Novosphingobium sp. 9]|uniref:hypothetical protein n=1 Tax=Novosphingobium sp. 9 TaxID=2025349 RepID=UPI0021B5863A|nr:hypothetical protein [Novosphingobium sp. 9]
MTEGEGVDVVALSGAAVAVGRGVGAGFGVRGAVSVGRDVATGLGGEMTVGLGVAAALGTTTGVAVEVGSTFGRTTGFWASTGPDACGVALVCGEGCSDQTCGSEDCASAACPLTTQSAVPQRKTAQPCAKNLSRPETITPLIALFLTPPIPA